MDRRTPTVATNVAAAMHGTDVPALSKATGIPAADLHSALHGRTEFQMSDLLNVGGFLRVPAESFLVGVAP
jgi:hypothetical protein